ncbi:hypothetical protein BURPS668_A3130 [Burkholderia pseudomallei 668]|nr:hypothetical protein BURPS668_A3130 [Burkholderia pseudomallei 668]
MHSGSSIELQLRTGAARTPVSISQAPCPSARSRIAHGSRCKRACGGNARGGRAPRKGS